MSFKVTCMQRKFIIYSIFLNNYNPKFFLSPPPPPFIFKISSFTLSMYFGMFLIVGVYDSYMYMTLLDPGEGFGRLEFRKLLTKK